MSAKRRPDQVVEQGEGDAKMYGRYRSLFGVNRGATLQEILQAYDFHELVNQHGNIPIDFVVSDLAEDLAAARSRIAQLEIELKWARMNDK